MTASLTRIAVEALGVPVGVSDLRVSVEASDVHVDVLQMSVLIGTGLELHDV